LARYIGHLVGFAEEKVLSSTLKVSDAIKINAVLRKKVFPLDSMDSLKRS